MSPTNTFFSVMAALSLPLVCMPLPWHLEAWNTGTCLFMIWTAVGLFITCVNSIIWRQDALVYAPVWCDITTKLSIGWSVGIPAASLCISRRLYLISSVKAPTWSKAEKVRTVVLDLAIGVLLPALVMALHYIIQGHRFNIYEEIGCLPTVASTWLSFVIFYMPPLIVMLTSVSYSVRTLLHLRKTQKELREVLSSNTSLTTSRFYRLMALASLDIFINLPFQLATVIAAKDTFGPWISWEYIHHDFGRISQLPSLLWKGSPLGRNLEFGRWSLVVCALLFFSFFGFAEEARKNYRMAVGSISKCVGNKFGSVTSSFDQFKTASMEKPPKSKGFRPQVIISYEKRNSAISFTTVGDTEVDTLHAPSFHGNTVTKNPLIEPPPSPSFRLSVPSTHDSFLEFSSNDREIPPRIVHKV